MGINWTSSEYRSYWEEMKVVAVNKPHSPGESARPFHDPALKGWFPIPTSCQPSDFSESARFFISFICAQTGNHPNYTFSRKFLLTEEPASLLLRPRAHQLPYPSQNHQGNPNTDLHVALEHNKSNVHPPPFPEICPSKPWQWRCLEKIKASGRCDPSFCVSKTKALLSTDRRSISMQKVPLIFPFQHVMEHVVYNWLP